MLSKPFEKYVKSLKQKKYRYQYKRFIAEGIKAVTEFLAEDFKVEKLIVTENQVRHFLSSFGIDERNILSVTEQEMKRISSLSNPSEAMLVAVLPEEKFDEPVVKKNFSLVLDDVQDPGNMGTIIRIADWFGIPYVFISENSVDPFHPKVVQSSMGSLARVGVLERNPERLFSDHTGIPVYGADVSGENILQVHFGDHGFILIGNEGHGYASSLHKYLTKKIRIPKYGKAESLNAAVAAGIISAFIKFQP